MADGDARFLRVRDPGDCFARAYTKAYYEPFTAATGIEIHRTEGGREPTELIRDMVDRQDYAWDVALTSMPANVAAAEGASALEPIGDLVTEVPDQWRTDHFLGDNFYAIIPAWRKDAFPDGIGPSGWADFWDVNRFPARRSLRHFPMDVLELALIAKGADPATLYPLDVDAAFASLGEIRPHIDFWWVTGGTTQQLLTEEGEHPVDIVLLTSLRALEAQSLGVDVGIGWEGNIRTCQGWGILKGSPRADLGRIFLEFVANAQSQAALCMDVGVSPTIPAADALIPAERQAVLPNGHRDGSVDSDVAYWSANKTDLIDRFERWMAN